MVGVVVNKKSEERNKVRFQLLSVLSSNEVDLHSLHIKGELGLIKRNFIYMDKHTFITLYKSLVRPHLEYANSVWSPYKKGNVEAIEKVQKRATKLVISLKHLSYKDRLVQLGLPTVTGSP